MAELSRGHLETAGVDSARSVGLAHIKKSGMNRLPQMRLSLLGGDAQQSFFSLRMVPIKVVKFVVKRSLLAFNLDVRRVASPSGVLGGFEKVDPITFQYLADLKIAPEMEI